MTARQVSYPLLGLSRIEKLIAVLIETFLLFAMECELYLFTEHLQQYLSSVELVYVRLS